MIYLKYDWNELKIDSFYMAETRMSENLAENSDVYRECFRILAYADDINLVTRNVKH